MGEPQACEIGTFKIANRLNIEDCHLGSAADSDAEEMGSKRDPYSRLHLAYLKYFQMPQRSS